MKRFLITTFLLALVLLGGYFAIYHHGVYLNIGWDFGVEAAFKTESDKILKLSEDGEYVPVEIKGVDVSSSIAGYRAIEHQIDHDTWLRWFGQIQALGANTIRIYDIYDDSFYNAFYEYNEKSEKPLYLLQGITQPEAAECGSENAWSDKYYDVLIQRARDTIDIVHGYKDYAVYEEDESVSYRKDVSPWVIGFILGTEWDPGLIAYTNHQSEDVEMLQGRYFETTEKAASFEIMLASVMNDMVGYESGKYNTQRLVSFINHPEYDPLEYEEGYASQLGKYVQLNAENVKPTEHLKSGFFASYQVYEFCPEYYKYRSEGTKEIFGELLDKLDTELSYDGYTQLLSQYHSIPVLAVGCGISTSRGTDLKTGPFTEKEQGEFLVKATSDILKSGCMGVTIHGWQDVWEQDSWNTQYFAEQDSMDQWHDIQTEGQGYGLLTFESTEAGKDICLDGKFSEWYKENLVQQNEDFSLYASYDEKGIYLLVQKEDLSPRMPFYIGIDVTEESGSRICEDPNVRFQEPIDFLLCVNGKEETRLLVHERYDSSRALFAMETTRENAYYRPPEKDSQKFVPIKMILQNKKLVNVANQIGEIKLPVYETYETGRLHYGSNDTENEAYDSLTDFCFGHECVEIRIPWTMLNFADPSQMKIHGDYYDNFGVVFEEIEQIRIGIGSGEKEVEMQKLLLEPLESSSGYTERLKQSYNILQKSWEE